MAANRVPPELLDEIIGNLKGNRDLCSASLVSSLWKAHAQRCLLARVRVVSADDGAQLEDFKRFLDEHAHLCMLIRHLELRGAHYDMPYVDADLIGVLLFQLANLATLILNQIRFGPGVSTVQHGGFRLKQLQLSCTGSYKDPKNVLQVLGLFKRIDELQIKDQSHTDLFNLPSRIQDPSAFMRYVDALHIPIDLSVSSVQFKNVKNTPEDFWAEILRRTRTSRDLQRFTHLRTEPSFKFSTFRVSSVALQLLHGAGSSVTHVTLGLREDRSFGLANELAAQYASDAMRAALSNLTSLRSLTLRLAFRQYDNDATTRAAAWRVVLALLSAFSGLALLELELHLHATSSLRFESDGWWCDEAVDLHALKTRVLAFREVERVVFRGAHVPGLLRTEKTRIEKELPELVGMGLVVFA